MPTFEITDPNTGRVLEITGDSPPNEQELEQIFASQAAPDLQQPPQDDVPRGAAFAQDINLEGLAPQARQAVLAQQEALRPIQQQAEANIAEREAALAALPPERRALIESVNPFEAALIGAGRGFKTIGRAVGLAEPEAQVEREAFEQLQTQQPISTTTGEILGEAAPFIAPGLGVIGGAAKAAKAVGLGAKGVRAAQFAGVTGLGATEAGLISRGRGQDIGKQFQAAGIGGTVAGALDLALPVIGRISSKIVRRITGRAPSGSVIDAAGNPSDELVDALKESGQSFDDIVREAKDELSKEAVEPREAARQAFLKSQGLEPTRAQISRNAADFQTQQEAAKTSNRVRDALESQEAFLTTRFNNAVLETGGRASSATSAVADAVTEKATKLDQEISDLYKAATQAAPEARNIRFDKLTETLNRMKGADRRAGGNISAIIGDLKAKGILDPKGRPIGRVDVGIAEEVRKLANELYDPANPFGNMLLRQVKDSLDDDVFSAAGKDFFGQARQAKASFEKELTRAKVSKFDSRKANLVRDVLEDKIDPDQIVNKVVFGKGWRHTDLKQLKDYVSTDEAGKAAFDDMRAEVMQSIKDKAFIGPIDEAGFQVLSRDKLQKAVNSIGRKKLNVLFTPEENKFLRDMLEVAKIREPVRGTALGRGPSAQAILSLEKKIQELPALGPLVKWLDLDIAGRGAIKAKPTAIKQALPKTIAPALAAPAAVAATQQEQP